MIKSLLPNALACLLLAPFTAAPAFAQAPAKIAGEALNALASGRSWAISYYGDPVTPGMRMVWDFRKNGSVCARAVGAKAGDKCMDEGRWAVKGELFCWELSWIGEAGGYKAACFSVKKVGSDQFELLREKQPELRFAVFKVL